jgi:hypothetical protein
MIAHNFLHGSGQAGFSYPALALGENDRTMQGMTDGRHRQPASDEAPHTVPEYAAVLTAPRKRAVPEPPYLEPKNPQRVLLPRHAVIPNVSTHRLQPLPYFGDGFLHASLKFGFHLVQLRLQLFANRLPQHREPSLAPLSREVSAYVHGVYDRTGIGHTSRYRRTRWGLPLLLTASASRSNCLSTLRRCPGEQLRMTRVWAAVPLSYDSCMHYILPV